MADHLRLPVGTELGNMRSRGGGPNDQAPVNRSGRGRALEQSVTGLQAALADDDLEEDARAVLKFRSGGRITGNGLWKGLGLEALGENEEWTYFVLSTRESRLELQNLLSQYVQLPDGSEADVDWDNPKSWATFIDLIEDIELYGPEDRADPSLDDLVFDPLAQIDVLLWPSGTEATAASRIAEVREVVESHAEQAVGSQVRVLATDPRPDRTLLRIEADELLLEQLLDHFDIERIRAPLSAAVTQQQLTGFTTPDELPDPADTPIGVIDSVIVTTNPLVGPYVLDAETFPSGHTFTGTDNHGTAVAGCAIWGDLDVILAGALPTPHPVVSARVMEPITGPSGEPRVQVVGLPAQTIEEAIEWLVDQHDIRVVCISVAYNEPAKTALRNELTLTLDELARKHDIVIVVPTGNRGTEPASGWQSGYPGYVFDSDAGVASPGDGAIVVTIGSIAKRDVASTRAGAARVNIAGKNEPSPFTRTGPVRGRSTTGMLKPEFTHHGGNWAYDSALDNLDSTNPGTSSIVTIPPRSGRVIGANNGTSYAAPKVAHEIARIAERYPEASANLLRALTALSARRPVNALGEKLHRDAAAYGEPDADRVLESTPQRVFLTHEGETTTSRITLHRLPIPAAFADGNSRKVFRVALAFDPPVRRQRREYIAGNMTVELVRGMSFERVQEIYSRQPTTSQAAEDPSLERLSLPERENRPILEPGEDSVSFNTLVCREFIDGRWDPEHDEYVAVIRHNQSAWTEAQRRQYASQSYALAVEVADETRTDIDLYALMQARLAQRIRFGRR